MIKVCILHIYPAVGQASTLRLAETVGSGGHADCYVLGHAFASDAFEKPGVVNEFFA
jgi:hypothetical protein